VIDDDLDCNFSTSPQIAFPFSEKLPPLSMWRGDKESSTFRNLVEVRLKCR
jgi:hypothetical protein